MKAMQVLVPVLTYLIAGLVGALAAKWLRLNPIVGYLLAGVAAGPFVLGALELNATTRLLAELGVAFLLFEIGTQFSLREVQESRKDIFVLGTLQMALCVAVLGGGLALIGFGPASALILAGALALSSTAVIVRILTEKNRLRCPVGRSAVSVSVFQDICAILLLVVAGALASGVDGSQMPVELGLTVLKVVAAAAVAVLIGRFAMGPIFRVLFGARNDDVFLASALILVLAAAGAASAVGLSMTLGAFLAGIAIAESPYRMVLKTELKGLRALLLSLFFITVGLGLDLAALWPMAGLVVALTLGTLVVKTALTWGAARLAGKSPTGSLHLAFILAQASEFTLVILALPLLAGQGPPGFLTALVASTVLSLAVAPFWVELGDRLAKAVAKRQTQGASPPQTPPRPPVAGPSGPGGRPVIVLSTTPVGRLTADALREHDLPHVVLEPDAQRFLAAASDGYNVLFGDPSDLRLIDSLGMAHAGAIVIAAPRLETSTALTPIIRERFPDLTRFVVVTSPEEQASHAALGMRAHLARTSPEGVEMVADLLRTMGVPDLKVARWMDSVRPPTAELPPLAQAA
jgi:CPA2 family monovalent cation:H+ antiporter-2